MSLPEVPSTKKVSKPHGESLVAEYLPSGVPIYETGLQHCRKGGASYALLEKQLSLLRAESRFFDDVSSSQRLADKTQRCSPVI